MKKYLNEFSVCLTEHAIPADFAAKRTTTLRSFNIAKSTKVYNACLPQESLKINPFDEINLHSEIYIFLSPLDPQ